MHCENRESERAGKVTLVKSLVFVGLNMAVEYTTFSNWYERFASVFEYFSYKPKNRNG